MSYSVIVLTSSVEGALLLVASQLRCSRGVEGLSGLEQDAGVIWLPGRY